MNNISDLLLTLLAEHVDKKVIVTVTFRMGFGFRLAGWIFVGLGASLVVITSLPFSWTDEVARVGLCVAGLALLALGWRGYLHPQVHVADDALIIVNPIRAYRMSWGNIVDVQLTRIGLILTRKDSGRTTAWAVQSGRVRPSRRAAELVKVIRHRARISRRST
jgi:hypothetical protein